MVRHRSACASAPSSSHCDGGDVSAFCHGRVSGVFVATTRAYLHAPLEQFLAPLQTMPQPPQLFLSSCTLTQVPEQLV